MKQIITSIPLFVSTLALFFFFFLPNKQTPQVRMLPYLLFSIIARSIFLTFTYYKAHFNPYYDPIYPPFTLLSLSLIYLFMYEYLEQKKAANSRIFINLLPATISFILFLMVSFSPLLKIKLGYFNYISKNLMGFFLTAVYFISIYIKHFKLEKTNHKLISSLLLQLGFIFFLYSFFFIYIYKTHIHLSLSISFLKLIEISLSLTFYFYLFNLYKKNIDLVKKERLEGFYSIENWPNHQLPQKTSLRKRDNLQEGSFSKDMNLDYYIKKIESFFADPANYIDSNLSQKKLAQHLEVSSYHLSLIFNKGMHTSFPDYLNNKRIAYACELLKMNKNISITQLTEEVGYKSRTSFYNHFNSIVGCTPLEFTKKL